MVNNKWKVASIVMSKLFFLVYTTSPQAADVTVTVNGSVVATPCDVVTASADIDLKNIYVSDLKNPGSSSNWHDFSLELVNCPTQTSYVVASFRGAADSGYHKNIGTAKNIQLHLQDDLGNKLSNGATKKINIDPSTRAVSIPLQIRALSVTGNATKGTIQATINVTYSYQ